MFSQLPSPHRYPHHHNLVLSASSLSLPPPPSSILPSPHLQHQHHNPDNLKGLSWLCLAHTHARARARSSGQNNLVSFLTAALDSITRRVSSRLRCLSVGRAGPRGRRTEGCFGRVNRGSYVDAFSGYDMYMACCYFVYVEGIFD